MLSIITIASSSVLQGGFSNVTLCWTLTCLTGMKLIGCASMYPTVMCWWSSARVVRVTIVARVVLVSAIGVIVIV